MVFRDKNVYLLNYHDLVCKNKLKVIFNRIKLNSNGVEKFDFKEKQVMEVIALSLQKFTRNFLANF
jgi:hypothetical protein